MRSVLRPYRRHLKSCPHAPKGRRWDRCHCPLWVDGRLNGARIHHTLDTTDWTDAQRKVLDIQTDGDAARKSVADWIADWKKSLDVAASTRRLHENVVDLLAAYCAGRGVRYLAGLTAELLTDFRASRSYAKIPGTEPQPLGRATLIRELQSLRQFLAFCQSRGGIRDNPARLIKPPKGKPTQVMPYSDEEMARILEACDQIGETVYNLEERAYVRARARALILVMRYTGLAIGDAIMLRRDAIQPDGYMVAHRQKTGKPVRLPLAQPAREALAALPLPRSRSSDTEVADIDSQVNQGDSRAHSVKNGYFFWNGVISQRALFGIAERIMGSIKRLSGVAKFGAHRFRHSLAVAMLAEGGSLEDVAQALGNTARKVEEHYAPWVQSRQDRLDSIMERVHGERRDTPITDTVQ